MIKNFSIVLGANAFTTLEGIIGKFFKGIEELLNKFGLGISATVFGVSGVVLLVLVIFMLWQVKNNQGTSQLWEEHAGKIIAVIIICLLAGLFSAAFFAG